MKSQMTHWDELICLLKSGSQNLQYSLVLEVAQADIFPGFKEQVTERYAKDSRHAVVGFIEDLQKDLDPRSQKDGSRQSPFWLRSHQGAHSGIEIVEIIKIIEILCASHQTLYQTW